MNSREVAYRLAARFKRNPTLFLALAGLREDHKKRRIRKTTSIVIEGPPRSGNHYATYAFIAAQELPVEVAHHFHAPAQLMLAARWNIPAILLIRRPDNMAVSQILYMQRKGFKWYTPELCAHDYASFYDVLWPHRTAFVIAVFEEFIERGVAKAIREINSRFDRDYRYFNSLDGERKAAINAGRLEHIMNPYMKGTWWTDPTPNPRKELEKAKYRKLVHVCESKGIFDSAWRLYNQFTSIAT